MNSRRLALASCRNVAKRLPGERHSRTSAREWRHGKKGSPKNQSWAGTWKNFEAGEGGGWLHVSEGEVTALALAVQCALLGEGFAIATRGGRWLSRFILPRLSGQAPGANPYRPGPAGAGATP